MLGSRDLSIIFPPDLAMRSCPIGLAFLRWRRVEPSCNLVSVRVTLLAAGEALHVKVLELLVVQQAVVVAVSLGNDALHERHDISLLEDMLESQIRDDLPKLLRIDLPRVIVVVSLEGRPAFGTMLV